MLLSLFYLLIFFSGNSAMIVQACVSHNVFGPVVNTHLINVISVAPSRSGFSLVACADWCTGIMGCPSVLWTEGSCGHVSSCAFGAAPPPTGEIFIIWKPSLMPDKYLVMQANIISMAWHKTAVTLVH